jgi:hypothetical protein
VIAAIVIPTGSPRPAGEAHLLEKCGHSRADADTFPETARDPP